ncbi:hypothetical protein M0805_009531 [Coniferiporia weirii]|nr:hypothetical protein M0805_009531 [Coniferiporia weirii]
MPPRLSKRQQREQEELLSLAGPSVAQDTQIVLDDSDADDTPATRPVPSGFSALAQPELDDEEEEEEERGASRKAPKKKNKKKKKKDAAPQAAAEDVTQRGQIPSLESETQPIRKRGGKKEKVKTKTSKGDDDGDDLDKALAELSVKYPDLRHVANSSKAGTSADAQSVAEKHNVLLAVSLPNLDSEAEMRKFFGAKVVKQPRGARAAIQGLKSNLTKPQPTWWSASQREGLSIRPLTLKELENKENGFLKGARADRWWTIEYSKRYRNVTKAFVGAVMSGDPDRFYRILSKLPWHADTLLQMSEVYRHREEHASSVDYLNRALFTYERSFIGAFAFTSGSNRLDFDRVENRPFYLALSRMVTDLQRRGCSRSAFEFARLLLSLDPYSDPHGALLYLDCLAIKSGMHDWLLSMWELYESEAEIDNSEGLWYRFNVTALPGWCYARALALRAVENSKKQGHEASNAALEAAISAFPCVVPLLADKVDISLPGELRGHPSFRVHVDASSLSGCDPLIHLLAHLYAHRSSSLWKPPENASWLKEMAISVFQKPRADDNPHPWRLRIERQFRMRVRTMDEHGPDVVVTYLLHSDLAKSIYRHAISLADANTARRLTAFFPPKLLNAPSLSCDPLPPNTAVSTYDDEFFADCEDIFAFRPRTRREREIDARNLERMIPDVNVRHQIQALYDVRQDIQRQFPDGVAQFAQVAAQLGEDFWDNFLPQNIGEVGAGGGGMPGQFEDLENLPDDDDDEIHPGDDGAQPRPGDAAENDGAGIDGEEDASDDETEAAPIFPVRVWHNLVNRFWGGDTAQEASDSDSEGVGEPGGERR